MRSFDQLISPSIFGLTFLLAIGLVFFIRASTKDRTEKALYVTDLEDVILLERLQAYFASRSYRVTNINQDSGQIALEGEVGASVFLAIFLGGLAGTGFSCLALVLTIAYPQAGSWPFCLLLLSPLAVWFYWRGATRVEQVTFQVRSPDASEVKQSEQASQPAQLVVTAHRDELAALASQIPLKRQETD